MLVIVVIVFGGGSGVLQWVGALGLGLPFVVAAAFAILGVAGYAGLRGRPYEVTFVALAAVLMAACMAGTLAWALALSAELNDERDHAARMSAFASPRFSFTVYAGDDTEVSIEHMSADEWAEPSGDETARSGNQKITHEVGERVVVKCQIATATERGVPDVWFELEDRNFLPSSTIRRTPFTGVSRVPECAANPSENGESEFQRSY